MSERIRLLGQTLGEVPVIKVGPTVSREGLPIVEDGTLVGINKLQAAEYAARKAGPQYEQTMSSVEWLKEARKIGKATGGIEISRDTIASAAARVQEVQATKKDIALLSLAGDLHIVASNGHSLRESILNGTRIIHAPSDGALQIENRPLTTNGTLKPVEPVMIQAPIR